MRVIDLTHTISTTMPVYPGTEPPQLVQANTMEIDGFAEKKITMYSHTGTHIDAPAHLLEKGNTLDQFPLSTFLGNAIVLDVSHVRKRTIDKNDLAPFESLLQQADFVLLYTGWSELWGQQEYFTGFPVLSADAARWLTGFALKGLGVDTVSVDIVGTVQFEIHKIFLEQNILLIENLAKLSLLSGALFQFSCFPLKFQHSDGSPVRAVGILYE